MAEIFVNTAYETFALKISYLDKLGSPEWHNSGIENWVQIELALGFIIRGMKVTTNGKQKRQCDLLVSNHGIELRCLTYPSAKGLLRATEDHPKAEFYLFLAKTNQAKIKELDRFVNENGFGSKLRMLNGEWMVMVLWKK